MEKKAGENGGQTSNSTQSVLLVIQISIAHNPVGGQSL